MNSVCIYHGVDLDGFCSGAIWWRATEGPKKLIPMNYGWDVPWDDLSGAEVTMIDFSFQPFDKFVHLAEVAKSVVWIDHHSSAIEETNGGKRLPHNVTSFLDTSMGACELAWKVLFGSHSVPRGVFLLSDYDCWRHSDPETMPYQMGMRYRDMEDPRSQLWDLVFEGEPVFHESTIAYGETILQWEEKQNASSVRSAWFPAEFAGYKWMAVNRARCNSMFWDAVWDDKYDGMLAFSWIPKGYWNVSLYSSSVDCGQIASENGGGGHKGAAGFQWAGENIFHLVTSMSPKE